MLNFILTLSTLLADWFHPKRVHSGSPVSPTGVLLPPGAVPLPPATLDDVRSGRRRAPHFDPQFHS